MNTTITATALRALLEGVAVAAGTDKTLPMLCAVNLEWSPGRLTAVATDRYRMVVGELTGDALGEIEEEAGSALLPVADVQALVKALPKPRRGLSPQTVRIEAGDGHVTFTGDGWSRKVETLSATFVQWQAILWDHRTEQEPIDRIGWNPQLMASVAKVPTDKGQPWAWHFRGALKPAIGTASLEAGSGGIAWRFLLTPVRLSD